MENISATNVKEIRLDKINISKRLRDINKDIIAPLSDSIQKNGLLNPITINQNNVLITGYHRYKACESLNYETIMCNIVDAIDEDSMKLIEIDENLIRAELHYFDLSAQLKLRKEIYERNYPQTVLGGTGKGRKKDTKSFVDDVVEKINKSKSSIYSLLNISDSLNNEEKTIIKELNLAQNDTKLLTKMKPDNRKEVLKNMKTNNLNLKETIKHLKKQKDSIDFKNIIRPLNDKFIDYVQVGDTIEIINNISNNNVKYDCFLVDINAYSENQEKQLKQIDNFLNTVDNLLYDDSILFFFSNEKIDNKLESKLITKFNRVERAMIRNRKKEEDSLFKKAFSTIYVCRNFKNTIDICLGSNEIISEDILIDSIADKLGKANISIFEPYVNSLERYKFCKLNNINYFGICSDIKKYTRMDKIIDLTQYFDKDFSDYYKLFDKKDIAILKNCILTLNDKDNKRFHLKINDEINQEFTPIYLDNEQINKILEFTKNIEDFKIWFYIDHISLIVNNERRKIYNVTLKNDLSKEALDYFNIDKSDKVKIDFLPNNSLDTNKFDIYEILTNEEHPLYVANSKLNENLQVLIGLQSSK